MDDTLRHQDDGPSIGLLLCKTRERVIIEYALRDVNKPIGVAEYQLTAALPDTLKGSLPTIEELEAERTSGEEGGSELSLADRLYSLKLPMEERRRIMEEQAENLADDYEQDPSWRGIQGGDITDE